MSSTNKTSLGLNMWEPSDKPVRQDFVNDNAIIDEKITNLNSNLATHKSSGDHDGRYYTESEINTKLAAITPTNIGAYSNIKVVYATSSSTYTLAAGEIKALAMPTPSSSDINGYGLIGAIRAYCTGSPGIVQAGYWGNAPGNDIWLENTNSSSSTFHLDVVYLYAKK